MAKQDTPYLMFQLRAYYQRFVVNTGLIFIRNLGTVLSSALKKRFTGKCLYQLWECVFQVPLFPVLEIPELAFPVLGAAEIRLRTLKKKEIIQFCPK